jgi:hypothetical protein
MAAPKKSGTTNTTKLKKTRVPKKTTIGHSKNTRLKSKNDKRQKKLYRGQGR